MKQNRFPREAGLGIPSELVTLAEGDDLRVSVSMRNSHPHPPEALPGFARAKAEWKGRLSHDGATIAPFAMGVSPGRVHLFAAVEEYSTNRAASDIWRALPRAERERRMGGGFDPLHSRFLGTACAVIGSDGLLVLARRSMKTATEPGMWAPAIGEGMDDGDLRPDGSADVRGCILRGGVEELGLSLDPEDTARALRLHSVTVHGTLGEVVVNASLDLRLVPGGPTSEEVIRTATREARDAWERDRYAAIPLTPEAIRSFALDRPEQDGSFSGYGLATARLALQYERTPEHAMGLPSPR